MPIEDAPALEDGSQVSSADARSNGWLGWIADRLIRWRVPLFLIGVLLVAVAVPPALRLQLDESIESFYAPDDPHLLDYQQSKRWFGGDEFVLVAYHDRQLLETEGLERLREFSEQLSQVPGVNAQSTQDLARTLRPPEANLAVRLFLRFPTTHQSLLEFSRSILVGEDNETTAIVLRLLPEDEAPVPRKQTLAQIRRLADAQETPTYVAGEPVQVNDMFRYVRQDGALLGWATSGMLIVTILVLFRSLRWMLLPLLIVHAALIWTKAILVLSGMKLSMVSSILTSLITIIGIATVTHVTVRFRELRRTHDRIGAFRETFVELAPAVFWTCATTAIGFAALLSSGITPVRSFGTMVALGTLLVLAGAIFLLPGGVLIGRIDADPRRTPAEGVLLRGLDRLIDWVENYAVWLLIAFAVLSVFSFSGLSRLTVETNFIKNFRQSSPIVESIEFFEERLGGVGTWEVNFPAPQEAPGDEEGTGLTQQFVDDAQDVSEAIAAIQMPDGTGPTKALSLGDGTEFIPRIAGRTLDQKRRTLKLLQPEFEQSLYNAEAGRMRIVVRALEQQPAETKLDLIAEAEDIAQQTFPEAKATGLYVLLAHLIQSLLADQLVSFLIAAAGIALAMSIAFRSLPIGLMSIVPNVFPILVVIGMMGWLGVPINIGTAMIASVSMGLTVDATIHYLAGYRRSREAGMDHFSALRVTHAMVGRAVIFATAALILGFTVLTLSHFIPLIYFGVLVSAAMAGGLLGSLVLLPLLLKWFEMPLRQTAIESSPTAAQDRLS